MLAINNEKNNIDLTYMPERPTDVQRRRKSSDASYESTTPPSPPSYDLFVSHNIREIKQPKQSQKIYEPNETIFDYKLSYIFKEHGDVLEELLSSDPALTNMIYDMINISNTNKIDLEPKKDEPKKDQPKEDEPKKDEPKKDELKEEEPKEEDEYTNNNEITYDDIYNNDEIYVEEYKRRCFIS